MQLNVPLDSHIAINKWARQYGPLYKIFVGHTPVIIVTGEHVVCDKRYSYVHICSPGSWLAMWRGYNIPCSTCADADLVKQVGTKSFMKFHNRPQPIMRFHHGSQTEFEEAGMLFARCLKVI